MVNHRRRPRLPNPRGFWFSVFLFLSLMLSWLSALTILFMWIFDNFLFRLTHPFESGWSKGPWGFVFIYGMLAIPVLPIYNRIDRQMQMDRLRKLRKKKEAER